MSRKVYPVPGNFLMNVPAVPHDCDDPFCVESGAFTTNAAEAAAPKRKRRTKRKSPAAALTPEGPADAGPLDSAEEN